MDAAKRYRLAASLAMFAQLPTGDASKKSLGSLRPLVHRQQGVDSAE